VFTPRRTRRLALDSVQGSLLDHAPPEPLHLVAGQTEQEGPGLLSALRGHGRDTVVNVEVGRYDKHGFDRPQVPLVAYLDLLVQGRAYVNSQPVHLAQWRAFDDLPALGNLFPPPNFLSPLADIYQTSLFVGPSGAVTPLHSDPYENVFEIAEASQGATKHFCLFPPACSSVLAPPRGNTSKVVEISLVDVVESTVRLESGSLDESEVARLARDSQVALLARGDILVLPRRWFHRVQNCGLPTSVVAGIARWWLLRAAPPTSDAIST
jgi:Cupin-like domain